MTSSQASSSDTSAGQVVPARLLFICWGNICRSPTAEGLMRAIVDREGMSHLVEVDSAGTSGEHTGNPPDRRAIAEAARRGIDLRPLRARKVHADDWTSFDLLLVADGMVENALAGMAPSGATAATVHRMTAFGPDADQIDEVPDPYYGAEDGFVEVYDMLERACTGLLDHIRAGHVSTS